MLYELIFLILIGLILFCWSLSVTIIRIYWVSTSHTEFLKRVHQLFLDWSIFSKWYKAYTSNIPLDVLTQGYEQIGEGIVYLANVPKPLSKERLLLEIVLYVDLYSQYKKKSNRLFMTAISHQSYKIARQMLQDKETILKWKPLCHSQIRWTSDSLRAYNPNGSYLYFSTIE